MWVYRLAKTRYLDSSFSGVGARLAGGRWNSLGVSCIYGSLSEAQAVLEVLVHIQSPTPLEAYSFCRIQLKESDFLTLPNKSLPKDWNALAGSRSARDLGDEWLESQESLALIVPSVITTHEKNVLINPDHPQLNERLKSLEKWAFNFDPRLPR